MQTPAKNITYIAQTNFRNSNKLFGIWNNDRMYHTFILGKTGTGKTTLLKNLILQDIWNGNGCCFFDPHGDVVSDIARNIPEYRTDDVIYLDCTDPNLPWGYNPLKTVPFEKRALVASGMLEIFEKLFGQKAWGAKMEHILRNVLLTLLDQPTADLRDINRVLTNRKFAEDCLQHITNPEVSLFWTEEFFKYPLPVKLAAVAPIQNKVGGFLSNPVAKKLLVEFTTAISIRQIMDTKKILLVNLSKGQIGEDASSLLGALLLHSVGLAAFSRADMPKYMRIPFYLYADEFQNFTTQSIANMQSEIRKFSVCTCYAAQYLSAIQSDIKDAILGNVGTLIVFRLGVTDAKYFEKEFYPYFSFEDIINLPNYKIYLKLMIDGSPSKPFSADCMLHIPRKTTG